MCTNKNCTKIPSSWSGSIRATILTQLFVGLMLVLGSQNAVFGQNYCPNDPVPPDQPDLPITDPEAFGSCAANDIVILGAFIELPDACNTCEPGTVVTGDLIVIVDSTTNSQRSMTVWSELEQVAPDGTTSFCRIGRCFLPLTDSQEVGDRQEINTGPITFTCGDALTLTEVVIAYSAAGPNNAVCPLLEFPPSKCKDDTPDIEIVPPLNATIASECGEGNTGNFDLTVTGGSGNFSYDWDIDGTGDFDDPEDLTNVPLGTYTVVVQDNENNDELGQPCTVTQTETFNGPCCEFFATCNPLPDTDVEGCDISDLPPASTDPNDVFSNITTIPCGTLVFISQDVPSGALCPPEGEPDLTVVRTYTLFDDLNANGELDEGEDFLNCEQNFTIEDNTDPDPPEPPADVTVQCADDVPAPVDLTAEDVCDGPITVSPTPQIIPGSCPNDFVMIRTWTFVDSCGNETSVMQTITVKDDTAPVAPTPPADVNVQCATDVPAPVDLTAEDNCDGTITVSPTEEVTPGACVNDFTLVRTWTFMDVCGNTSSVSQTITVKDDTAPVAPTPPADVNVQCATDVPAPVDLTAEDNCDGAITVSPTEEVTPGACVNDFTLVRTWTFTDVCGNTSSVSQTITVKDDTAPVAPTPPADVNVQCATDVPAPVDLTAEDNCDGAITVSPTEEVTPGACVNDFTLVRTWTFTDVCGNTSSVSQTITVKDDTAPVAPTPPADVNVQCATDVPAPVDLTAEDNCDGTITVSPTEEVTPGACVNDFTLVRTWTFMDVCGNTSSVSQTITVKDDTAPVAPTPPADVNVQCATDVPAPVDLTAEDNCDGAITVSPTEEVTPGACVNDFTLVRTWTFTDVCGNTSSVSQTITVKDDTAPVAPTPPADVNVQCATDVPAPVDLTAEDNCDGAITVSPTEEVTPGACVNDFTLVRTWTFTDVCGNTSSVSQTITVKDDTAPVAPTPPADVNVQCATDVPAPVDLTAEDNCDGAITVSPTEEVTPGACVNDFTLVRTWTFTDVCGNTSSVSQTITVKDDTAPVAPTPPADVNVQCATDVPAPVDLTAEDNCDGAITVSPTEEVTPGACVNDFTLVRTWTFTDVCGNTSSVSQTITVKDDTAPVAPTPPADVNVQCATDVPAPVDLTAEDNCDGAITVSPTEEVTPGACVNDFTLVRTWTFTDVCGNTSSVSQTITVKDDTAPVAPTPPADVNVQCATDVPAPVDLTAEDNCDGAITVSPTEEVTPGACVNDFTLVRTWTFMDVCGNTSSVSQTITVKDDTAPVAPTPPADVNVQCATDVPAPVDLTAEDNCDGAITVSPTEEVTPGACVNDFTLVRTWTFTDVCGNTSSVSQTITVKDDTAPVAPTPPADVNVQCATDVPAPVDLTAEDNCDGAITVSPTEEVTPGACVNDFTLVRTWTFMDVCGNTSSVSQTITVKDDTAPVAPTPPADVNVQCATDVPAPVDLTAEDNCDGAITVSPTEEVTPGACVNDFTLVRTWTFTDVCGNTSSVSQTITVKDDTAPVISGCPEGDDLNIVLTGCGGDCEIPDPPVVTAMDNCDGDLGEIDPVIVDTGEESCPRVITRTWTATDECGNTVSCSQTIVCEPPIAITPTGTECTSDPNNPDHGDFGFDQGNGNFIPLEELTYQTQTKQGVTTVKNANPGAMILFRKVVSTEETITITIDQSNTLGWDPIEYPQNLAGSIRLYDEGCIQLNAALVSVDVDGNGDLTAVFNVDNPDGDPICYTFYAKSLPSSLKGNEVDPLGETGEYCFNVEVDSDATTTEEICIDVVQE